MLSQLKVCHKLHGITIGTDGVLTLQASACSLIVDIVADKVLQVSSISQLDETGRLLVIAV